MHLASIRVFWISTHIRISSMNRFRAWTWFLHLRSWMAQEQECGNWRRPMRSRLEVRRLISTAQWIRTELDTRSKSKAKVSLRNKHRWQPQVSVDMQIINNFKMRAQRAQGMLDYIKPRLPQRTAPRRCQKTQTHAKQPRLIPNSAREVLCFKIQQWR